MFSMFQYLLLLFILFFDKGERVKAIVVRNVLGLYEAPPTVAEEAERERLQKEHDEKEEKKRKAEEEQKKKAEQEAKELRLTYNPASTEPIALHRGSFTQAFHFKIL